jgi:hypothetical protein
MDPRIGDDAVSNPARAELWQTVLPILVEDEDGSMEVAGTGFVVLVKGRQAHPSPHSATDRNRPNSPLLSSISANRCISGSSRCSGMFGISS